MFLSSGAFTLDTRPLARGSGKTVDPGRKAGAARGDHGSKAHQAKDDQDPTRLMRVRTRMKGVQAVTSRFAVDQYKPRRQTMADPVLTCDGQDEAVVKIWAYWGLIQDRWLRCVSILFPLQAASCGRVRFVRSRAVSRGSSVIMAEYQVSELYLHWPFS